MLSLINSLTIYARTLAVYKLQQSRSLHLSIHVYRDLEVVRRELFGRAACFQDIPLNTYFRISHYFCCNRVYRFPTFSLDHVTLFGYHSGISERKKLKLYYLPATFPSDFETSDIFDPVVYAMQVYNLVKN